MTSHDLKTFFVTEVASGFGNAFANAAFDMGHRVIGTLRDEAAVASFEALAPGRAIGRIVDLTQEHSTAALIDAIEREIGPIDVVINNAGATHEGLLEESSLDEVRRQFDAGVFGAIAVMKGVLPHMRVRRAGHILNITSTGGMVALPGLSVLHGSKFALEGFSEAVGKEVAAFGIRVTTVESGCLPSDWTGLPAVRAERTISDYDAILDPVCAARARRARSQPRHPEKDALAVLAVVDAADPPSHLLLGNDAIVAVRAKVENLLAEINRWETLSRSTDRA